MRKSRFTEAQIVTILREADKGPIGEVAKKHGVSEKSIYTWRKRLGAMDANEVKRLRELEQENARLKKLLAERDLELDVVKEIAAKNVWSAPYLQDEFPLTRTVALTIMVADTTPEDERDFGVEGSGKRS